MCDKMAIFDYILKIVEKNPFLRLERELRSSPIFSTNKRYVKIKLMQNEINLRSIFW